MRITLAVLAATLVAFAYDFALAAAWPLPCRRPSPRDERTLRTINAVLAALLAAIAAVLLVLAGQVPA